MRIALSPVTQMLAIPVAFWGCGSSSTPSGPSVKADASAQADASGFDDATGGADDASTFADAAFDGGVLNPDASALDAGPGCAYPPGAVEPMALDQVISPYSWGAAIDGANMNAALSLEQAHCNNDPARDWAGVDVLLFVTAPSW